jgi:hypothetical protein
MGDPPDTSDDTGTADLRGPDGAAVARGVMEENAKLLRQLREAVQKLHRAEGQPAEELVRDVAQVIAAANAVVNGTSWDPEAKAAYGNWQRIEGQEVERDTLVGAAEHVRDPAEQMLDAAGTMTTEDAAVKLQDWADGATHLDAVVREAAGGVARLDRTRAD